MIGKIKQASHKIGMKAITFWLSVIAIVFILLVVVTVYVVDNIFALTIAALLVALINTMFHIIH